MRKCIGGFKMEGERPSCSCWSIINTKIRQPRTLSFLDIITFQLTAVLRSDTTPSHVPGAKYCTSIVPFYKGPVLSE